eukprot:c8945_g1_i1 orf=3-251(-)
MGKLKWFDAVVKAFSPSKDARKAPSKLNSSSNAGEKQVHEKNSEVLPRSHLQNTFRKVECNASSLLSGLKKPFKDKKGWIFGR